MRTNSWQARTWGSIILALVLLFGFTYLFIRHPADAQSARDLPGTVTFSIAPPVQLPMPRPPAYMAAYPDPYPYPKRYRVSLPILLKNCCNAPAPTSTPTTLSPTPTFTPTTLAPTSTPTALPPTWTPTARPDTVYGVPSYPPDYTEDVETWWAGHPLNPDNPEAISIGGLQNLPDLPVLNVAQQYGSDLQAAIDALPAGGGTLVLDPGTYNGFRIVGKNSVHIISSGGATIRNAGSGPVGDRDSNVVAGCSQALDYGLFNSCTFSGDPSCLECLQKRVENIYIKNITFDGAGSATEAVGLHAVRGVVLDNVTFQNYYDPESGHGGLLGGNAMLDNVWCRGCDFVGNERWAVYLDGAHASGIIRSQVAAFPSGSFLFLSNNDFDIDLNENGAFEPDEIRQADYLVIEGNTIEGSHQVVNVEGGHTLVKNNIVTNGSQYFVWQNSPSSFRGVPLVDYYGNRIVGNHVDAVHTFVAINGASDTHARAGLYEVRDNTVEDLRGPFISESGTVDGPNLACGNTADGVPVDGPCAASTATPTPTRSPTALPVTPTPTRSSTALPPTLTPTPNGPVAFPLGVFEDGNLQSAFTFGPMIDDLRAHNLDAVYFVNTWAAGDDMLDVSDAKGFDVYYELHEVVDQWFTSPVAADIDTARSIIYPLVDVVKGHPSLQGYNVIDEPTADLQTRVALAVQAYRERDPQRKTAPVLIGIGRADSIFAAAQPDIMLLDVYPFAYHNEACDTTMNGFGYPSYDLTDYIRAIAQDRPADTPLWVILQTHNVGDGQSMYDLRDPTAPEVRQEFWLSIGEGATGIFWFIYSSEQGWTGLRDNPTLFTEVSSLAQRIGPLRGLLTSLHKAGDEFGVDGSDGGAYISTLASGDGSRNYVVIVNRLCAPQALTVTSLSNGETLQDLETGEFFAMGSSIPMAAGDGRILEVTPP